MESVSTMYQYATLYVCTMYIHMHCRNMCRLHVMSSKEQATVSQGYVYFSLNTITEITVDVHSGLAAILHVHVLYGINQKKYNKQKHDPN